MVWNCTCTICFSWAIEWTIISCFSRKKMNIRFRYFTQCTLTLLAYLTVSIVLSSTISECMTPITELMIAAWVPLSCKNSATSAIRPNKYSSTLVLKGFDWAVLWLCGCTTTLRVSL